jgi:hypothetical protein
MIDAQRITSRRCEFGDSERSRSSDLKREYSADLRERVGGYTGYVVLSLVGMKPPPSSQLQPQRPLPIFSG